MDKEKEKTLIRYNGKVAGVGMDLSGLTGIGNGSPLPLDTNVSLPAASSNNYYD
jgi:hypothetical protein